MAHSTAQNAVHLLRRLGRSGMVDEALAVFSELDPHKKNTYVRNVIIDLLLKSGRVDSALNVLDEMLLPGSEFRPNDITADIVFTKLLKINGSEGRVKEDEIAGLVAKFGKHHVVPNPITLTQLISKLCRSRNIDLAWSVLDDLMMWNGLKDAAPCNALLTGLGKEREFEKMNLLMRKMKDMNIQPNVITFGILINHLCKFRRIDDALEVFEKMKGEKEEAKVVAPDTITYNTLIDGLCKVGRQEEGLRLMGMMRSDGCAPNTVTYNCLIDGYCKAGEIERAHELFNEMVNEQVVPNVITLNTLVDGMCKHGRISSAVEFFREMQQKGLKGNSVTYTVFINAFCKVNNIDKAMEFFDEMSKAGCFPDAIVYYTLICGLAQAGRLDDASFVVLKLKEAGFRLDLVCYNLLISEFCKKNKLDKANELLNEMELVGVKPDSVTYNTLISYFSKIGNFKLAHKFMKKMTKEEGLLPTVFTYGALIHAYCLNNNTDEAMKLFKEMNATSKIPPNTVIYNILIDSLCKRNEAVDTAVRILKEGGMDAIKLEGGAHSRITAARAIVEAGIAVMGHVGLTPQAISVLGGFRPQGKNIASAVKVVETAISLQEAGCFAVVLECVPPQVAAATTAAVHIPTIGIGAGPFCSGQVLVYHDLLGMLQHPHHAKVTPKFCKQFAQVGNVINKALSDYKEEVSNGSFPGPLHSPYKISDDDFNGFLKELQNMGLDKAAAAAAAKANQ